MQQTLRDPSSDETISQSKEIDVVENDTGKTLVRKDLVDAAYRVSNLSREEAATIMNSVLDKIVDSITTGDEVKLHGFGKFTVLQKRERIGRNPRTGVEAVISARRTVSFRPSPNLIDAVNRR
ncbi:MAG: integration host factor subunit alpha [Hyphomicrobiales bacterium]|nr:integration host factor subunit alpha [Hyphomicrobiales bacterium]